MEVEVKIIDIDRGRVEERLRSLGASKTFEGEEDTRFFDFPTNQISQAKNLLRLRKKADKTQLTFKKFVASESVKVRDEYEVMISEFEPMRLILEGIGLVQTSRMVKHRVTYSLGGGVRVDLDKYSGDFSYIPDFMEIEAKDVTTVQSNIKLLGFEPEEGKNWTTFDLIDHYSGRKAQN